MSEEAERIAAAALQNAMASVSRINDLLAQSAQPAPSSEPPKPPPGLTPEQEVQWWNEKIAMLSNDADKKGGLVVTGQSSVSTDMKGGARKGIDQRDGSKVAARSMTASEEAEWMDQRMARLAVSRSERKGGGESKDCK